MGIIERKKAILLNEPHLETASGSVATFDTDMRSKLKECKINFLPVQSGSGDPSLTNIRPISGRTGISIINNVDTIPVSWQLEAGTLYGGYVDLISGELVVTHKKVTLGVDAFPYVQSNGLYFILSPTDMLVGDAFTDPCSMCDKAVKVLNRSDTPNTTLSVKFGIATRGAIYLYNLNRVAGITTQEAFNSWIVDNPITYIYPLATPQTYQLTPQTIKTLIGRNNIWSDAGDVEVKYWIH